MVAVTYGVARVPARVAAETTAAAPRRRWYARVLQAMMESRLQQARQEIARHAHLLPYSLDERGNRLARKPDEMPFGGW